MRRRTSGSVGPPFPPDARRGGMSSFEAVLCAGACVPMAAVLYWIVARAYDGFVFAVGTTVGSPYM